MKKMLLGFMVVVMVVVVVLCAKSVSDTEKSYGGSFNSCVELGHERAMCKRVFEF